MTFVIVNPELLRWADECFWAAGKKPERKLMLWT